MNAKDQLKLLKAGFTLVSCSNHPLQGFVIRAKTKEQVNWHTLEKDFKSKAALTRRMRELLSSEMVVDPYDTLYLTTSLSLDES